MEGLGTANSRVPLRNRFGRSTVSYVRYSWTRACHRLSVPRVLCHPRAQAHGRSRVRMHVNWCSQRLHGVSCTAQSPVSRLVRRNHNSHGRGATTARHQVFDGRVFDMRATCRDANNVSAPREKQEEKLSESFSEPMVWFQYWYAVRLRLNMGADLRCLWLCSRRDRGGGNGAQHSVARGRNATRVA